MPPLIKQQVKQIIREELISFLKSDRYVFEKNVQILDGRNIQLGTDTGTKIGTATGQKLSFFNSTPVTQPSSTGEATGFTAGGTAVGDSSTFTGNVGSTAYRISDIVKRFHGTGRQDLTVHYGRHRPSAMREVRQVIARGIV